MESVDTNTITIIWGQVKLILPWSGWVLFFALLGFLAYLYKYPENFDAWLAKIDKFLLKLGLKREKQFIQRDIRSRINRVSKKINKEAEGLITKGIEIVWVNQDNIESFLKAGKVIVRMRHYENQDRNIVNATFHYVMKGVLHTAKIYLPEKIQTALNLSLTKKILAEEQEVGTSTDYFFVNLLRPMLAADSELNKNFMIIEKMEKKGLFTRILLREIRLMGKKNYPAIPTNRDFKETNDFFAFLEPFANIESGDLIQDWEFIRDNIRVGLLFVAKRGKLEMEGYGPYINRINEKIARGTQSIYLFGRQNNNVKAVIEIAKLVKDKNKKVMGCRTEKYQSVLRGERVPEICIVLKTAN